MAVGKIQKEQRECLEFCEFQKCWFQKLSRLDIYAIFLKFRDAYFIITKEMIF